jgi:hypothetical protein
VYLLGRDGGVSVDQSGEHTAESLQSEGERSDIQQQDVLHIAFTRSLGETEIEKDRGNL